MKTSIRAVIVILLTVLARPFEIKAEQGPVYYLKTLSTKNPVTISCRAPVAPQAVVFRFAQLPQKSENALIEIAREYGGKVSPIYSRGQTSLSTELQLPEYTNFQDVLARLFGDRLNQFIEQSAAKANGEKKEPSPVVRFRMPDLYEDLTLKAERCIREYLQDWCAQNGVKEGCLDRFSDKVSLAKAEFSATDVPFLGGFRDTLSFSLPFAPAEAPRKVKSAGKIFPAYSGGNDRLDKADDKPLEFAGVVMVKNRPELGEAE